MTHLVAEDIGPATLTVVTAPGDAVIVALDGDLDIAAVPAVRERLLSLLGPGASRLVIDMSAVRYADASGLDVLVGTRRRAILLGGTLHLAAVQPEVARVMMVTGLSRHLGTYPTVRAAVVDRRPGIRTALPGTGPAVAVGRALPVQAPAALGADSGELHAAVAALLASADAWRDADPRRRFSPVLSALAQADAGSSHAALLQAARSLLSVLSREPLTYSPAVAATAGRLRRLFAAGPRPVMT
ncbi:MAG TPA: STAS domain-containing protein [Trebonia sp.]|nr:STAS domain-containing protein [Trebonia sp.]